MKSALEKHQKQKVVIHIRQEKTDLFIPDKVNRIKKITNSSTFIKIRPF